MSSFVLGVGIYGVPELESVNCLLTYLQFPWMVEKEKMYIKIKNNFSISFMVCNDWQHYVI